MDLLQRQAMIEAVERDPTDETARLIAADFFEENGHGLLAIRLRKVKTVCRLTPINELTIDEVFANLVWASTLAAYPSSVNTRKLVRSIVAVTKPFTEDDHCVFGLFEMVMGNYLLVNRPSSGPPWMTSYNTLEHALEKMKQREKAILGLWFIDLIKQPEEYLSGEPS